MAPMIDTPTENDYEVCEEGCSDAEIYPRRKCKRNILFVVVRYENGGPLEISKKVTDVCDLGG